MAAAAATASQDTDRMAVSSDVISPHSEQGKPDALVEEKASLTATGETTSTTPLMWTAMTLSLSQDTRKVGEAPKDQSHVILTRPLRSQLLRNKDFQTNIEELTGQRPSVAMSEFQHVVSEVDAIQPAGSHAGIAAHKAQTEAPDADPTFPRVEPGILNIRVLPEKVPPEKERKGLSPPPEIYHDMVAADSIAPEIEPTKSPSERGPKVLDIRSEKAPVYPQKDSFKTKSTKGIDEDHGAAKMDRAKTKITRKSFHFVIYKGMKRLKDDK